jgi:DNA repair protein RadA/Sms
LTEWYEDILYLTEESADMEYGGIWGARLFDEPEIYNHLFLAPVLGSDPQAIYELIEAETNKKTVVIDTARNALHLQNENDPSEMANAVNPFIALCKDLRKTLIILHHNRKGGGEGGEGISGAHALLGSVDIALEIRREGGEQSNRRIVRGWGRINEIQSLLYEMKDGKLEALGKPGTVHRQERDDEYMAVITDQWQSTREIWMALQSSPSQPSESTVKRKLEELFKKGDILRHKPKTNGGWEWRKLELNVAGRIFGL